MEFSRQEHWSGLPFPSPKETIERKKERKWSRLMCLTLCDPMDCSLPGSSIHGIVQARVLEWVATSFSTCNSIDTIIISILQKIKLGSERLSNLLKPHSAKWYIQGWNTGSLNSEPVFNFYAFLPHGIGIFGILIDTAKLSSKKVISPYTSTNWIWEFTHFLISLPKLYSLKICGDNRYMYMYGWVALLTLETIITLLIGYPPI